jgi:hypothetical protein
MDNVQNCDSYINTSSSQTYRLIKSIILAWISFYSAFPLHLSNIFRQNKNE